MISDYEAMQREIEELLRTHAVDEHAAMVLAPLVARQSMLMHHLYQDLGFKTRAQMGKFMQTYFPLLAMLKPKEKLWKKFLFDTIERIAPACAGCSDQISCFACQLEDAS